MSDVSKSLFIATILFTSTSPSMLFSQEPSPSKTGNVAEVNDSLSTEPTAILIMRPELDSLRTMAAAIVARNKHIRIQEPGAASGESKQLEAELWLQPEVPNEIVEKIIGDVAKFGIVRIQLVRPFHDPDNTVVITAPANTPQGTIKDLQTNLALPDGFKLDVRSRDNEPSPSITPPKEIHSQITQLEVELALQKLRLVADHPSIQSLEERIATLRKVEESEPKSPVTVVPLRHAKATDVAEKIKQLDLGPVDAIVVDERTNSLMIRGTERQIKDIEQLIEVLDAEVSPTGHGEVAEATTPANGPTADGASPLGRGASGGRSPFGGNEPGKQTVNDAGLPELVTVKVTASKAASQHPELKPLLEDLRRLEFPDDADQKSPVAAVLITIPAEFSREDWIKMISCLLDSGGARVFFVDRRPEHKITQLTMFVNPTINENGTLVMAAESIRPIRTRLERLQNLEVKFVSVTGDVSKLVQFKDDETTSAMLEIKTFALQHLAATEVQRIIVELFGNDGTAISAEPQTNTLLVRGESGRLAEIEAILMRLDEKAAAEHKDATTVEPQTKAPSNPLSDLDGGNSPPAETPIAEYRRRLVDLEKPVLELAEKARASESSLGKEHPEYQKLLADLRALIQQTFAARQEIQRAELAEFTRRLERMKQSIETREKIADKIVDRRVEELLNPNIEWQTSTPPSIPSSATRDNRSSDATADFDSESKPESREPFSIDSSVEKHPSVSRSAPKERVQLFHWMEALVRDIEEFEDRTPLKLLMEFKDRPVLEVTDDFKAAASNLRERVRLGAPRAKLEECFAPVSQKGSAFVQAWSNVNSQSAKVVLNEIAEDIVNLEHWIKALDSHGGDVAKRESAPDVDRVTISIEAYELDPKDESTVALLDPGKPVSESIERDVDALLEARKIKRLVNADVQAVIGKECEVVSGGEAPVNPASIDDGLVKYGTILSMTPGEINGVPGIVATVRIVDRRGIEKAKSGVSVDAKEFHFADHNLSYVDRGKLFGPFEKSANRAVIIRLRISKHEQQVVIPDASK